MFFETGFPPDWSTHKKLIWMKAASGGSLPWQTFTGNPLQFDAPKAHTLRSTTVEFAPQQDLHGYANPWPAGGGKNKFDPSAMPTPTASVQYHAFYVGDGTWTASTDAPYGDGNATVFFLAGDVSSGASTSTNGISPSTGRTQTAVDGYVTVAWRTYNNINPSQYHIQIESGSSITSWTPYSNECPISGWTALDVVRAGENLWYVTADDVTEITYTTSIGTYTRPGVELKLAPGTYYIKAEYKGEPSSMYFYGGVFNESDHTQIASKPLVAGTHLSPQTFTVSEGQTVLYYSGLGGSTIANFKNMLNALNVMLNLGSTASPYEPLTGETIPVQFRTDTINQWDEHTALGYIDINGVYQPQYTNQLCTVEYIPVNGNTKYRAVCESGYTLYVLYYDENKDFISSKAWFLGGFTTPQNCAYIRFNLGSYGTTYRHDVSINYPSTETAYHPYLTTVYGGYLRINRDGSVDLIGEWKKAVLNGSHFISITNWRPATGTSAWLYDSSIFDTVKSDDEGYVISDKLKSLSYANPGGIYYGYVGVSTLSASVYSLAVRVPVEGLNTKELINAYLAENPIEICYELASPVTYHLPSLAEAIRCFKGINTIWSDANGDVTVEARAEAVNNA